MGLFNKPIENAGGGLFVGEQFTSTQTSSSLTIISALDPLILTQDESNTGTNVVQVPNSLDLTVHADRVVIAGPISMPARNVTISARAIEASTDGAGHAASISVAGVTGGDPPGQAVAPGQAAAGTDARVIFDYPKRQTILSSVGSPGTPGNPGQPGSPGGPGGSIVLLVESFGAHGTLTLVVDGGVGGAGQHGQDGGEGGRGGNGCFVNPYAGWLSPSDGGPGGAAGAGGKGGPGGSAGAITLSYVDTPATLPTTSSNGGGGGSGGKAGTPGPGGPGGQQGGGGATGGSGGATASDGLGGDPGAGSTPQLDKIQYSALASGGNAAQLLMMLQRAKLTYLTADPTDATGAAYQTAATLLAFLIKVTTPPLPALSADDAATLGNINTEASVLGSRLARALDFYGNPPNWVPMVAYATYGPLISGMVTELATTETTVNDFFAQYASVENATSALTTVVGKANAARSSAQQQLISAQTDAAQALVTVENGDVAVNDERVVLMNRIQSLESDLEAIAQEELGKECVFENLTKGLEFISTVAGIGESKKAGAIAKAAKGLIPTGNAGEALEAQIKQLDVLGATIDSLPEAVKIAYDSPAGPIITPDDPNAYKLLQAQSDFDTMVQKFTSVTGAAQEAIDAMNRYVSLVLQRNADVLSYNAKINQINALQAEIAQATALIAQAEAQLQAANPNPQLPSLVAFVARLYEDSKWRIIQQYYLAFRALSHWSLNTSYASFYSNGTFSLDSLDQINAGTLSAFESTMQSDWVTALDAAATPRQTFPASGPGIQIVIDNPDVIAALQKNYKARFSIPPVTSSVPLAKSRFAGRCNVRITKVRPWLTGAKAIGNDGLIEVTISHLGRETIVDRSDNVFVFVHQPTDVIFSYPETSSVSNPDAIQEEPNFGYIDPNDKQELQYALLSPFTTYQLKVDPTAVDLSSLTSVTMEFFGTNDTFPQALA